MTTTNYKSAEIIYIDAGKSSCEVCFENSDNEFNIKLDYVTDDKSSNTFGVNIFETTCKIQDKIREMGSNIERSTIEVAFWNEFRKVRFVK